MTLQFRTSLPAGEEDRLDRQREFAEMLKQLRDVVKEGLKECERPGWEVVVLEASERRQAKHERQEADDPREIRNGPMTRGSGSQQRLRSIPNICYWLTGRTYPIHGLR